MDLGVGGRFLMNNYQVLRSLLSTRNISLNLPSILQATCYEPHFTNNNTEAQK